MRLYIDKIDEEINAFAQELESYSKNITSHLSLQEKLNKYNPVNSFYQVNCFPFRKRHTLNRQVPAKISNDIKKTEEKLNDLYLQFQVSVSNRVTNIYSHLNFSALSGEYVRINEFEVKLGEKIKLIESLITSIDLPETNPISRDLFDFISYFKSDISAYRFEVHRFFDSISSPEVQYLDYEPLNEQPEGKRDPFPILSETFRINVVLMFLDRELLLNVRFLKYLNQFCHKLIQIKEKLDDEYVDILIDKCHILIDKFAYKVYDSRRLRSLANYYKDTQENISVNANSKQLYYKWQFPATQECIYNGDKAKRLQEIDQQHTSIIRNTPKNFLDYYILCHYYKNIAKNQKLLERLITDFENQHQSFTSDYDKNSLKVSLNYLSNCKTSLCLAQPDTTYIQVLCESEKLKLIQDKTKIKNYYPWLKLAQWYSAYITSNIENTEASKELPKAVHELKKSLDIAEQYLNDSKDNAGSFIPFRPPYNECLNPITLKDGTTLNVFISTAYIVPVDFDKERKIIDELKSEYLVLRSIVDTNSHIHKFIDNLTNKAERSERTLHNLSVKVDAKSTEIDNNLQNELKDHQKNNIQILAIFAAIVIFASSTVQLFRGATTIKDATIFMLLFAVSLGIISTAIWLIFGNKTDGNKCKTLIVCLLLIIQMSALLCAIFGKWGQTQINQPRSKEKPSIIQDTQYL